MHTRPPAESPSTRKIGPRARSAPPPTHPTTHPPHHHHHHHHHHHPHTYMFCALPSPTVHTHTWTPALPPSRPPPGKIPPLRGYMHAHTHAPAQRTCRVALHQEDLALVPAGGGAVGQRPRQRRLGEHALAAHQLPRLLGGFRGLERLRACVRARRAAAAMSTRAVSFGCLYKRDMHARPDVHGPTALTHAHGHGHTPARRRHHQQRCPHPTCMALPRIVLRVVGSISSASDTSAGAGAGQGSKQGG